MSIGLILLILLLIFALGGLPNWGFHRYGYGPSGVVGFILVIVLVMVLMGRL